MSILIFEMFSSFYFNYFKKYCIKKNVHQYSYGAYARLNNYAMTVGLKDRYANIRNELTSKDPPNDLNTFSEWAQKTNPNKPGFRTPDYRDFTYGFSRN